MSVMGVAIFFGVCIAIGVWLAISNMRREAARPPSPELVCPHCGVKGHVIARPVVTKDGISGAKATGAILTAGLSTAATGLSRKSAKTRMECGNCQMTWLVV